MILLQSKNLSLVVRFEADSKNLNNDVGGALYGPPKGCQKGIAVNVMGTLTYRLSTTIKWQRL